MTIQARALLDSELNEINQSILSMGSKVDTAIGQAIDALMTRNAALAQEVIAGDAEINRLRFFVEEKSYVVLATQQPMARDLRTVIAAIHFAIELERIGDHAAGIARIVTRLEGMPLPIETPFGLPAGADEATPLISDESAAAAVVGPEAGNGDGDGDPDDDDLGPATGSRPPKRLKMSRLPKMSKRARDMLNRAITAYIERDVEKATAIVKRDRKINRHYRKFFSEAMETLSSESIVEMPTYLLWIAHNLERIGDRTTNLAERVIFMVTGQYTEVLEDYE